MSSKKISKKSLGYRIIKKDSSDELTYSDDDTVSSTYSSEGGGGKYKYTSITESAYKKPKTGSKQDNMTKEQIRQKLQGYKALRTPKDKKYLLKLKPFRVWIRYFNTVTKEFRVGGLLKLVDPELRYIMLVNTNQNLTWSVQLKDNIIFVPDNIEEKEQEKIQKEKDKEKEKIQKEKLFKLYKQGKLIRK